MLSFYHHLPFYIDPVIFSIGSFAVRWYSVMYLVAIFVFFLLVKLRIRKKEGEFKSEAVVDFLIYAIIGMLVGARIGYVLFYDLSYFANHPAEIFIPRDNGISGLSYHGGLAGIIISAIFFCKKKKISFWKFADFVLPAIPAAYFFGRIGNFLNGELFGRATQTSAGMYFYGDASGILRHPSQLYEAFFEGIVLFAILWFLRNRSRFPGFLLCVYLFGYGFFRFFIEFFREPDSQIGLIFGQLSLGQILSLIMMIIASIIYSRKRKTSSQS